MSEQNSPCVCSSANSDEHSYVRIKINHSKENKAKGFYILMTNGNTYSDKLDEFIVEKRFLKLLRESNVAFEELPLNPSNEE
jgi:hypothetical protein